MRGRLVGSGTTKGAHGGFGQSACASAGACEWGLSWLL